MSRSSLLITAVSVTAISVQLFGHHSLTPEFNTNQIRTIHGTIGEVSWGNPHVTLNIVTSGGLGKPTVWKVVGDSPSTLAKNGTLKKTFVRGDEVTVCGYEARNQQNGLKMVGEQVEFPSGEKFRFSTTEIKKCYPIAASSTRVAPTQNPVGVIANPIAPAGNPIGPAGNPVPPFVMPPR
jgi:hypothetical protein